MLFSDPIFLFAYLPAVMIGYYLLPYLSANYFSLRLKFLIFSSLVFYSWWYPPYLLILIASILFNFWALLAFQKLKKEFLCAFAVLVNLGILFYFKYFNFFVDNLTLLTGVDFQVDTILLPLAISFFTFQQIAYVMDVKRGLTAEYSFTHYCMFVTFFPQLIAGPIVHHSQIVPQFSEAFEKGASQSQILQGVFLFFMGLFKKVCIADSLGPYSNSVFDAATTATLTLSESFAGIIAYTLQIYFDFSGYSDMAIGLGLMFGLRLPENFNSPYKSKNIIDFWRCWHITLSSFLRDYVYISMGGNRFGKFIRYRNLYLTMLIGGLWHGASWTFVIWGALHGMFLIVNHLWRYISTIPILARLKLPVFFTWSVTFVSVALAWVYFRASSVSEAHAVLSALIVTDGIHLPQQVASVIPSSSREYLTFIRWDSMSNFGSGMGLVFIFIGLLMLPLPNSMEVSRFVLANVAKYKNSITFSCACLIYVSISSLMLTTSTEFLYFNF